MANDIKFTLALEGGTAVTSGLDSVSKKFVDLKTNVKDAMQGVESALGFAKTALVAFAGVASINAFKGMIQGSIEATAGLHDMAIQTGASVAALTAFRSVAATTNTSIEGIAGAMNKMAKGMAVANEDSRGIGQAVQALGLDFNQLKSMRPEDQMLAVAKAMDGFQDGAGKSAAAMALYGKEGAKMLPFLKDLADETDSVTQKLTAQQEAAKKAQASMADDFTDNMTKIKKASEAWKKDVAMAMLPALYEMSQAFIDVNKGAGGIKQGITDLANDGSITNWTRNAIFGVTYVMDAFEGLKAVITTVGKLVGANVAIMAEGASMVWNVMKGLFGKEPVINIINASMERQRTIAQGLAQDLDQTWGTKTFGARLRERATELEGFSAKAKKAKENLKFSAPGEKDSAEKISEYQKLMKIISEKNALEKAEVEIGGTLTDGQKFAIKVMDDLRTGTLKLTDAEKSKLAVALESYLQDEKTNDIKKEMVKLGADLARISEDNLKKISAEIEKQREHNAEIGKTPEQITAVRAAKELLSAASDEELASNLRLAANAAGPLHDAYLAYASDLDALAKKKRELAGLKVEEGVLQASEEVRKEIEKTAEKINGSITDALMRGFESGKGFAENLRDTVANMFKTLVLRPTVSFIVNPVAQGITGMMGLTGAANAAGTASSMSGVGSLGALTLGGSTIAAIGSSVATGVSAGLAGTSLAGATAAYSAAGMTGVAGGLSAGSAIGSGLAAIGPVGWAALAAIAVSQLIKGNGGTPTSGTGEASATFDSMGRRINGTTIDAWGGLSKTADKAITEFQKSYAAAAKSLGAGLVDTTFSFGSNTGKDGQGNNFALGVRAGASSFSTGGEQVYSDAAFSLAASRAVFAALQGSNLPQYLAKVFDGLTAGELTQDQITNTMAYAQSLKSVRDALLETREPLQILTDNVAEGVAALGTSAETFKADFVAAIDAGITPDKLAQWQGLQTAMTELAQASGKATDAVKDVGRSIADIANERARLQDQLDELTMTSAQLLEKQRNAVDDSNKALFDQVQAQIQLKDAAQAAADAAIASAEAQRVAASQRLSLATGGASDALAALGRAVSAQKAQEAAQLAAQKEAAAAIYKAQSSALQTSMNAAKTSLDAVTSSVGKLRSLSTSLKSALDGMRIAGSDGAYRADAQAQIRNALARARSGGGLPVDGQLASALAIVSKPSEELFATFTDYARDFYSTANDISALTDLTDAQLTADEVTQNILKEQSDILSAQQQTLKDGFADQVSSLDAILSTAQQQLDAANGLDVSVLSIADALNQFNASVLKLANERAAQGLPTTAGVADGRAVAIRDYITSAASTLSGSELANTIAAKAKEVGTTEGEIARAIGWDQSKVREFFAGAGIPQFDVGTNYVPRDTLAFLHEGEEVTPKAWNPAAGGRAGNAELIAEIRALREEVRQLQQPVAATAVAAKKTAAMIETATEGGRAMLTEVYA